MYDANTWMEYTKKFIIKEYNRRYKAFKSIGFTEITPINPNSCIVNHKNNKFILITNGKEAGKFINISEN